MPGWALAACCVKVTGGTIIADVSLEQRTAAPKTASLDNRHVWDQIITIVTPGRQPLKDGNPESGTRKTTKALSVLARRGPRYILNSRRFTHPSVGSLLLTARDREGRSPSLLALIRCRGRARDEKHLPRVDVVGIADAVE